MSTPLFTTAELAEDQALAESRMLDTFEIRDNLRTEYDPELQEDRETYDVLLTTIGRVKVEGGLSVRDAEVGGRTSASVVRTLHVPIDTAAIPANAVAVCTEVHPTSDLTLLNARLRIGGPAPGSQTTARRLEVTEVLT